MRKHIKVLTALLLAMMMLLGSASAEVFFDKFPITDEEGAKLTIGITQAADVLDYDDNVLTKRLEELTGVDIEFVIYPGTDAETKLELQVASGQELPDILITGMGDANRRLKFGDAGVIIPLNDLYASEAGDAFRELCEANGVDYNAAYNQIVSADGNLYGMIRYMFNINNVYRSRAWINKTWLDKLGLEAPTNYEELITVATAFRDLDPNGNGEKDEVPIVGSNSWGTYSVEWLMDMFIYAGSNNDFLPLSTTDGKLDTWYDKPEYREALKYINKLQAEGLFSPLTFSMNQAQIQTLTNGDPCVAGVVFSAGAINIMNSKDEFIPLEALAGPEGVQWFSLYPATATAACAITRYCDNPELAFAFMNALNVDRELQYWNRFGEKDVNWRYPVEGEVSSFNDIGHAATVYELDQVWGDTIPQNKMWHNESCWPTLDMGIAADIVFDPDAPASEERHHALNVMLNIEHAPELNDVVATIVYTAEETEEWSEARSVLDTYVNEARASFIMGELDPNSDEDWQEYLDELVELQYPEILAMQQVAYDRTMGK